VARLNPATGLFDLYLDVQKAGNFTTQFGGNFSLANTSEAFIEFQYKYLWSNALRFYANGYFGKIYSSAKASGRIDFNSRLPLFLELAYTYNRFNYFMNATFFFDDKYPNYMYQSEYFGELRLGIPVTNKGKLVYSMTYAFDNTRYYQDNNFSSTDTTDQTNFTFFSPTLCFDLNGMNRKQYPNAGARLLIRLSYLYGLEEMQPGSTAIHPDPVSNRHDWFRLHVLYDNYFQAFGPLKLGFFGELDISNQPFFSNYISTQLYAPQFDPIPESQTYFLPSFRAMNYAATGLKAVVTLYKRLEYRLEAYIFQPYREIQQDPVDLTAVNGPRLSDHSIMGSTSLLYQSPLGPISLSVNYYEKKSEPFTINFNFGYILFNRRAIP
jgi:NTE family protein